MLDAVEGHCEVKCTFGESAVRLFLSTIAAAALSLTIPSVSSADTPPHPGNDKLQFSGYATGGFLGSGVESFYLTVGFAPREDYYELFATFKLDGIDFTDYYNVDYVYDHEGLNYSIDIFGTGEYPSPGDTSLFVSGDTTGHGYGQYGHSLTLFDVTGAPEPATWALMAAGVGVAGWALRRRQPAAAAVIRAATA